MGVGLAAVLAVWGEDGTGGGARVPGTEVGSVPWRSGPCVCDEAGTCLSKALAGHSREDISAAYERMKTEAEWDAGWSLDEFLQVCEENMRAKTLSSGGSSLLYRLFRILES